MNAIETLRDALGQGHYNRMRLGMLPDCILPAWEELSEEGRETYRQRTDYLLPALVDLVVPALEGAW